MLWKKIIKEGEIMRNITESATAEAAKLFLAIKKEAQENRDRDRAGAGVRAALSPHEETCDESVISPNSFPLPVSQKREDSPGLEQSIETPEKKTINLANISAIAELFKKHRKVRNKLIHTMLHKFDLNSTLDLPDFSNLPDLEKLGKKLAKKEVEKIEQQLQPFLESTKEDTDSLYEAIAEDLGLLAELFNINKSEIFNIVDHSGDDKRAEEVLLKILAENPMCNFCHNGKTKEKIREKFMSQEDKYWDLLFILGSRVRERLTKISKQDITFEQNINVILNSALNRIGHNDKELGVGHKVGTKTVVFFGDYCGIHDGKDFKEYNYQETPQDSEYEGYLNSKVKARRENEEKAEPGVKECLSLMRKGEYSRKAETLFDSDESKNTTQLLLLVGNLRKLVEQKISQKCRVPGELATDSDNATTSLAVMPTTTQMETGELAERPPCITFAQQSASRA
jgi:hypothetical protein